MHTWTDWFLAFAWAENFADGDVVVLVQENSELQRWKFIEGSMFRHP